MVFIFLWEGSLMSVGFVDLGCRSSSTVTNLFFFFCFIPVSRWPAPSRWNRLTARVAEVVVLFSSSRIHAFLSSASSSHLHTVNGLSSQATFRLKIWCPSIWVSDNKRDVDTGLRFSTRVACKVVWLVSWVSLFHYYQMPNLADVKQFFDKWESSSTVLCHFIPQRWKGKSGNCNYFKTKA